MKKLNKTKITLFLAIIFLSMSCSTDQQGNDSPTVEKIETKLPQKHESQSSEVKKVAAEETPKKKQEKPKPAKNTVLKKTIKRSFSNPNTEDQFTVSFIGDSASDYDGKVVLEIVNANGKELFKEESPIDVFIAHNVVEGTDEEREKLVRNGMDHYFDNFSVPAIDPTTTCEDEMCDKDFWDEIQNDPTAVGFFYPMNGGGGCQIAYSKKHQKVVSFYCCC